MGEEARMITWGVLRLPVSTATEGAVPGGVGGEGALAAGLSSRLDGALAITADASIAGALAVIPPHVSRLVEIDATLAEDAATIAMLGRLLAEVAPEPDAPYAAVAAARPMADALKRVESDVVVGGLDRDGLMMPCLPYVLDRTALAAACASDLHGAASGAGDAIGMLLAAGHAVRVVPIDGEPFTVRAAQDGVRGGQSA